MSEVPGRGSRPLRTVGAVERADAVFLFMYPSSGDTFHFPALSAYCSGELNARGFKSRVVEVCLDTASPDRTARALSETADIIRLMAPLVVIPEEAFMPEIFSTIRGACPAHTKIVYPHFPDQAGAQFVDFVVERFETNPGPLIELVASLCGGIEPVGIPNVHAPDGRLVPVVEPCAKQPMVTAEPDYNFIRVPADWSPASGRLSVYVNPGCPWAVDVARNPAYRDVDLSGPGMARHGCSFCLQDGCYSGLDASATVDRVIYELGVWRRFNPDCDEIVLWDESPWRFLVPLLDRLSADEAGPLKVCIHARCDHIVRQADVIRHACGRARANPDSGLSLVMALIGFENYSQSELDRMNKGYRSSDLSEAVETCRKIADEYPEVFEFDRFQASSFILFTPWTTMADLRENISGFRRDCIVDFSTGMGLTKLRLYDGLPILGLAQKDGLVAAGAFDEQMNASRRFGYTQDVPWVFSDSRIEQVYRLHDALYPIVERSQQVDLLEWCVDAVEQGVDDIADIGSVRDLFVRLRTVVERMNGGPERVGKNGGGWSCGRSGTLEVFLTGRGVPDGRRRPDIGCDPSPGRLAVRISRAASRVERIHVLGREPSLSPIFLRAVYLARQAGVLNATVRTDGLVFADPAAMARAIKAGVTDIEIRIFGKCDDDWRRATNGRGDLAAFRRAAEMVAGSKAAVRGRALVELGLVQPDDIPEVMEIIRAVGLSNVSWEAPVSCLPVAGLADFVRALESWLVSSGR